MLPRSQDERLKLHMCGDTTLKKKRSAVTMHSSSGADTVMGIGIAHVTTQAVGVVRPVVPDCWAHAGSLGIHSAVRTGVGVIWSSYIRALDEVADAVTSQIRGIAVKV